MSQAVSFPVPRPERTRMLACIAMLLSATAAARTPLDGPDPADPTATVPATTYTTDLAGPSADAAMRTGVDRLPWRRLFEPDGRFASGSGTAAHLETTALTDPAPASASSAVREHAVSDARGLVKRIDASTGKVTLRHGPIERLGMPGMTMVFRVKNPALLGLVKAGDEVGFTVEMDGSAILVTGFQD